MSFQSMSRQSLLRLPNYLLHLRSLPHDAGQTISAAALAQVLNLNAIQVRKDLASVSAVAGKPKVGFSVAALIHDIEASLGYNQSNEAVIIGAGRLGRALLNYEGFVAYGVRIVAAFDCDPKLVGLDDGRIFLMDRFAEMCHRLHPSIGVITVPAAAAQEACNIMVNNGIRAIWSFAPGHLTVPDDIMVQYENMAVSLALLSKHLQEESAIREMK